MRLRQDHHPDRRRENSIHWHSILQSAFSALLTVSSPPCLHPSLCSSSDSPSGLPAAWARELVDLLVVHSIDERNLDTRGRIEGFRHCAQYIPSNPRSHSKSMARANQDSSSWRHEGTHRRRLIVHNFLERQSGRNRSFGALGSLDIFGTIRGVNRTGRFGDIVWPTVKEN
jgi:hypothetical protein